VDTEDEEVEDELDEAGLVVETDEEFEDEEDEFEDEEDEE
ncbi:MAG: DNA-directed RNA polymerase subunit delta, partial [Macrococcus canis]|nr:DNA-directed RNA polymerase subunit delta [Macrococcus canis]